MRPSKPLVQAASALTLAAFTLLPNAHAQAAPQQLDKSALLRARLQPCHTTQICNWALAPEVRLAETGRNIQQPLQPQLLVAATLPTAPSTLLALNAVPPSNTADPAPDSTFSPPDPTLPTATLPIVNGRPYRKPTPHQVLHAYENDLIGVRPVLHAAVRAGIEQIRPNPVGWGQDFPGYLQRFGSAYGEAAIDNSVRFGLGSLLHEDVRYLICHHCHAGAKFANAALYEVTARHGVDGHRVFSPTPIAASLSGPLVAYNAWYPPGYTTSQAFGHVPVGVVTRFVFNCIREFAFDRDTPAEKAAAHPAATP